MNPGIQVAVRVPSVLKEGVGVSVSDTDHLTLDTPTLASRRRCSIKALCEAFSWTTRQRRLGRGQGSDSDPGPGRNLEGRNVHLYPE